MAQDTETTAVLTHSVLATARIFVVLLAGFLASKWPKHEPLLTREACRCVSRVCALLFQPALVISSTGGTLNFADLQDSWQLVVAGGLTVGLSVAVASVSARLLLGPESRRAFRPVELAIAFQNCAFIPLLLMESLCEQDAINSDFGDDADECFSQATSMIFLYYASWQVCFYAWGFYALGQDDTLELKLTAQLTREPPAVDDASATWSPFEYSPRVSEAGGTLSDDSTSSTGGETGDTLNNDSNSTSSIADGTIYTLSNDSRSSNSAKGGGGNGMVAVDVRQLDKAPVPAEAPPRGLLSDGGMVAADVETDSAFITPPPRLRANGTVPVDVKLANNALVAAPSSLRACHPSLENGIVVAPDVQLDAAALVSPPPRILRANAMVTGDVLQLGNALVAPPSPLPGGLRACDRNDLAKAVGHAQGGGGGGGSGGAEHVSDVQQQVVAVDGVNGEPSGFQVLSPQGGLRARDRNLAKGGGPTQGGGGGSGGDEYVTNVQQQVVIAVDDANGESSRFQVSPPPEGLRTCDRNLAKEGGHAQSGGGGGGGGYENYMGVRQVVAVDGADREPSRLQGAIVVPPSAEEITPQEWRSRDPESLVTAVSCRRNSMQQRTTSRDEINTALGTANAKAGLDRRARSGAVGPLATNSCRWNSMQRQTSSSEEHNVALDAAKRQRTTAADEEQNVALGTTAPKRHQQTTTDEESVALEAVHKESLGCSSGGGGGGAWARVWWRRIWMVLVSPNIIAVTIGIAVAMISPLQDVLFRDPQAILRPLGAALKTLGTPTVATSLLVMAGSLTQVPVVGAGGEQPGGNGDGALSNWRRFNFIAGALLVACRLVMVPAVGFGIFWVATEHNTVMGENRLMRMIMLIELAMPSGAFIIVSLNQLKMPATAGFMARLYLWQHGASILTITLWTALAVHMLRKPDQVRLTTTSVYTNNIEPLEA